MGRPETSGTRLAFNLGYDLDGTTSLYSFGNFANTDGRYRFFYRDPSNSDLQESLDKGAQNLARESVAGYTPFLDGAQTDYSIILGVKGEFAKESNFDISISTGKNELDYTLNNSLNGDADLVGDQAVRSFNTGDYAQEEFNFNVDLGTPLSETVFLAYGFEYREETFIQEAGDTASSVGGGASGLAGTRESNAGEFSRDNVAFYADIENDITDNLLMQYALRYEDFSDFGSTLNWKIATRFRLNDALAFRGAVSTGFHAPTPGQANLRSTTTTFDGSGNQIDVVLLPADSPEVANLGGSALKEEEALNTSIGFTAGLFDSTTLTVDAYRIKVEDRIYRTAIGSVSFYTNALDLLHQGIDVVLTSDVEWGNSYLTNVVFAYTHGIVEVRENSLINGSQVVSDDLVEDIENNYPNDKFTLSATTSFTDSISLLTRFRYIGDHFDERGNIAGTSSLGASQEINPVVYTDIELNYSPNISWTLTAGVANYLILSPIESKMNPVLLIGLVSVYLILAAVLPIMRVVLGISKRVIIFKHYIFSS